MLVERRREHDPHVSLVQRLRGAAQHGAEVGICDERQRQPDHAGPPAREAARAPVRAEPVLADDLEHVLAGFGRHVGAVVEDARDRGDRDAGEVGDVADGRAAPERGLGLDVGLGHRRAIEALGNVSGNSRDKLCDLSSFRVRIA